MIMNLVSDCIFVIYLVLLKKNTHFVSVFFVCTELMGLIEDRFPGKFVEFAESNFKFCFPNPAPVERLNVWNNVKLTGMSMTEYFQDAQVEIQDCDDDEEKVLFFGLKTLNSITERYGIPKRNIILLDLPSRVFGRKTISSYSKLTRFVLESVVLR